MIPVLKNGDVLLVDCSDETRLNNLENKVIVAIIDTDSTVKRLRVIDEKFVLVPENKSYPPIVIKEWMNFIVAGRVMKVLPPAIDVI